MKKINELIVNNLSDYEWLQDYVVQTARSLEFNDLDSATLRHDFPY